MGEIGLSIYICGRFVFRVGFTLKGIYIFYFFYDGELIICGIHKSDFLVLARITNFLHLKFLHNYFKLIKKKNQI